MPRMGIELTRLLGAADADPDVRNGPDPRCERPLGKARMRGAFSGGLRSWRRPIVCAAAAVI